MFTSHLSRRRFIEGVTLGGLAAALPSRLLAAPPSSGQLSLRGNHFNLDVGALAVDFSGRPRRAVAVNGLLPAPILRWREGERVTLDVRNQLSQLSAIHWHGIVLPYDMDGVPGISFDGIQPGQTFRYQFDVKQSGTYWYHGHAGFQEQLGLYGAIVIEPRGGDPHRCERDYVVLLSDWSDDDPLDIYRNLKKEAHYYNTQRRTAADLWRDVRAKGVSATWRDRQMWNAMRMSDRDLSDVTGMTYTFLMNGNTPAQNWRALFNAGERVRLRFINASAMTLFDVRIPELPMRVIAADGQNVEPVTVDQFRLGVAETLDVIVEPKADRAYSLFAQALDRSGYACGSLTPDTSLTAAPPALDPLPILSHADMGMAHGSHSAHVATNVETHAATNAAMHAGHDMHAVHGGHDTHSQMAHAEQITHPQSEFGNPGVDMRAAQPTRKLDDPGVGLRKEDLGMAGRRTLSYADLHHLGMAPDHRDPDRDIELHLTGNMARYLWSIDGVSFSDAPPLEFRYGERLRVTLVNDTMMHHPIHLHGMWSDLENGSPHFYPRKHTVTVKPGEKLSYRVSVDAPGAWAYHCHLMYHMEGGMFRKVVVNGGPSR